MTFRTSTKLRLVAVLAAVFMQAACTSVGNGLDTAGLSRIEVGRTTLAQAAIDLGAQPTDTWQQGDSLLARWAYNRTAMTDAIYVRQEVLLRFGPDGTFQRMENSVNVPEKRHPRTSADVAVGQQGEQALKAAATANAQVVDQAADEGMIVIPGNAEIGPIPVPPPPPLSGGSVTGPSGAQPLLPAGSKVVPGVTYPLPSSKG